MNFNKGHCYNLNIRENGCKNTIKTYEIVNKIVYKYNKLKLNDVVFAFTADMLELLTADGLSLVMVDFFTMLINCNTRKYILSFPGFSLSKTF